MTMDGSRLYYTHEVGLLCNLYINIKVKTYASYKKRVEVEKSRIKQTKLMRGECKHKERDIVYTHYQCYTLSLLYSTFKSILNTNGVLISFFNFYLLQHFKMGSSNTSERILRTTDLYGRNFFNQIFLKAIKQLRISRPLLIKKLLFQTLKPL